MTRELLTGNRLRRDGFRQLYFSLLMSVFSVHLLIASHCASRKSAFGLFNA
ncbi:MAG: hypothetical protein ACK57R_09370 [Dolichospermum sp.]|nr:hypothetical protein [Anabaena sp. 49628_E55]